MSGTGEPSTFLPPARGRAAAVRSADSAARRHDRGGADRPAGRTAAPARQSSMRELLRLREDSWGPRLRGASLVAEADLRPEPHRPGRELSWAGSTRSCKIRRTEGESFLLRWPACLAAAMAGVAATDYRGGTYWPALWETTGFQGTSQDQGIWGRAFNPAIDRLGMATFPDLPLHFLGPILMHAGIPTYCLGDYFRLLLSRRRLDPGHGRGKLPGLGDSAWP